MSHYFWAEFLELGNDTFRFDTRIYLHPIKRIKNGDHCIGAVVGKNPGSAKSTAVGTGIKAIELDGDKLLPTVRNIIIKAYNESGIHIPERGYVQVLNLFYLCNPNLDKAISEVENNTNAKNDPAENLSFPWVWYVWGSKSEILNAYKGRFSSLKSNNHFYYDKELSKVVSKPATERSFAKHTQGLKHALVVPYISGVIENV